jgi:hypothetical protein
MAGSYYKSLVLAFSFWLLPLIAAWAVDKIDLAQGFGG